MKKILIGSPINQKPEILHYFLQSLLTLESEDLKVSYLFIDDNTDIKSKKILNDFEMSNSNVTIYLSEFNDEYITNEETHIWNEKLIWKVAHFKNLILKISEEFSYDYVFLVDSDLVLHPKTLSSLIASKKEIVSNIFWTKWQPHFPELPQVWMFDHYEQYSKKRNENIDSKEIIRRQDLFIEMLKEPGIYNVGGLGACTLISKNAIKLGVNFSEIKNISFWGEDRHFCIRAQALGIDLFVDTHYPAFHIYRKEDLIKLKSSNFLNQFNYEFEKLSSTIEKGFKSLGSFHFEEGYKNKWENYFSKKFVDILNDNINLNKNSIEENSIIVEAEVVEKKIININEAHAILEIQLKNEGFKNGEYFIEKSVFDVYLERNKEGWIIDRFIAT